LLERGTKREGPLCIVTDPEKNGPEDLERERSSLPVEVPRHAASHQQNSKKRLGPPRVREKGLARKYRNREIRRRRVSPIIEGFCMAGEKEINLTRKERLARVRSAGDACM